MLEQIFGSKVRVKLLSIFLADPQKSYYIRELTRMLNCQINSIRREIKNLLSFGILSKVKNEHSNKERSEDGKYNLQKKYFQINTDYILYPELRSLILKAQSTAKNGLLQKIIKNSRISYLALTGIFVNSPDSLTDILIVGKVNKGYIKKIIGKFEKEINKNVNYTIISKSEFLYRKDITDKFLYNILESKKIVVIDKT